MTRLQHAPTPLLRLREVKASTPSGAGIGPIDWLIPRSGRLGVECAAAGQWEVLVGLITGRLRPESGFLEERNPVTVQTDLNLRETLGLNLSLADYLHSPDIPEFVWLENRRRSLWVLIDLLELSPHHMRRPLKMESLQVRERYWALRFMISRADLLIGKEVFQLPDPAIRRAFQLRWGDFPGALITGSPENPAHGALDWRITIDAAGRFACERVETPPPDGDDRAGGD